ncbi:hypothetical protein QL285_003603 [Trifolium repens]|nr:hypothetical protein QL285_003603 [Trifolium repens]
MLLVVDTEKGKNVVVASDNEKDDDIAEDDDGFGSSEDEAKGVAFDDSEDERGLRLEDGFEVPCAEPKNGTNRVIVEGKSFRVKHRANKNPSPTKKTQTPKKKSYVCDPEWEKEYMSEELNSDDPDDSDKEGGSKALTFNMDHLNKDTDFNYGMDFKSLHDFKEAIREWSILNGREIKYLKNDKIRCRIECVNDCGFIAHYSRVGQKHTYKIKTWHGTHYCPRTLNNRFATSKWVSKSVVKKLMVTDKVKVTDIMQDMRSSYSVGISFNRAWKARMRAKDIVEGDATKQYSLLWRYAEELMRVSKGNTFGRDANDQYFPLAFGVVENECKDSWRWFLTLLLEDIGSEKRWVFISDQQKGLMQVYEEMFDRVEHRLCLRHLYANFKKKFGGGTLIRDLMMGAAKAIYIQAWQVKMNELKKADFKAWEWFSNVPTKLWCKHAFSFYPKCDVLMKTYLKLSMQLS